ncbi:MAG: hypothetical protein QOH07_661, partial [Mycobacterium sp.]|nr:hypothetical protein [Mycobacterium sp.]
GHIDQCAGDVDFDALIAKLDAVDLDRL